MGIWLKQKRQGILGEGNADNHTNHVDAECHRLGGLSDGGQVDYRSTIAQMDEWMNG